MIGTQKKITKQYAENTLTLYPSSTSNHNDQLVFINLSESINNKKEIFIIKLLCF